MNGSKLSRDPQKAREVVHRARLSVTPSRGATVLIVDDDAKIRRPLRVFLTSSGYDVIEADNGRAAVRVAANSDVDLVLMDLHMPEVDGLTACAYIKKNSGALKDLPVVIVTGCSERDAVVRAARAGADAFVLKPFDKKTVISTVERLLSQVAKKDR